MVKVGKKREKLDNAVKDTTFSTHHRSSQSTSTPRLPVVPQYTAHPMPLPIILLLLLKGLSHDMNMVSWSRDPKLK